MTASSYGVPAGILRRRNPQQSRPAEPTWRNTFRNGSVLFGWQCVRSWVGSQRRRTLVRGRWPPGSHEWSSSDAQEAAVSAARAAFARAPAVATRLGHFAAPELPLRTGLLKSKAAKKPSSSSSRGQCVDTRQTNFRFGGEVGWCRRRIGPYHRCSAREVPLDPSPEVTLEGALDSTLDPPLDFRR